MNQTPTPDSTTEIALLKAGHAAMSANIARIETAQLAGMRRLEEKLDRIETELVSRPTEALAKSMARVQAVAAACGTGFISAVIFIAMNT